MNGTHKGVEMPIEVIEYLFENFEKIKEIEGEVVKTSRYGGSVFVHFKSGRCYRVNLSLYNNNVTLDNN